MWFKVYFSLRLTCGLDKHPVLSFRKKNKNSFIYINHRKLNQQNTDLSYYKLPHYMVQFVWVLLGIVCEKILSLPLYHFMCYVYAFAHLSRVYQIIILRTIHFSIQNERKFSSFSYSFKIVYRFFL